MCRAGKLRLRRTAAMRAFGARVGRARRGFFRRRRAKKRFAVPSAPGLHMVPSFHPDLVFGRGGPTRSNFSGRRPIWKFSNVPIGQGSGNLRLHPWRATCSGLKNGHCRCAGRPRPPSYALSFSAGTVVTTENQQYTGRRHGDPYSRCRCGCHHPQRAPRASFRSLTTKSAPQSAPNWTDHP